MVSMIGRNYARAIFELASEEGRADRVEEELPLCGKPLTRTRMCAASSPPE